MDHAIKQNEQSPAICYCEFDLIGVGKSRGGKL